MSRSGFAPSEAPVIETALAVTKLSPVPYLLPPRPEPGLESVEFDSAGFGDAKSVQKRFGNHSPEALALEKSRVEQITSLYVAVGHPDISNDQANGWVNNPEALIRSRFYRYAADPGDLPSTSCFIASRGEEVRGVCLVSIERDTGEILAAPRAVIRDFVLNPEEHEPSTVDLLVEQAIEHAWSKGCEEVRVQYHSPDELAIAATDGVEVAVDSILITHPARSASRTFANWTFVGTRKDS